MQLIIIYVHVIRYLCTLDFTSSISMCNDEIDSDDSDLEYTSPALRFGNYDDIALGKRTCKSLDSKPKRLHFHYNSSSRSTK